VSENALADRLNNVIDVMLTGGDATAALNDETLAPLARVAADLKHYRYSANPEFKMRLRASLETNAIASSAIATTRFREGFTTITPYLRVRESGVFDFLTRVFGAVETSRSAALEGGIHREVRVGSSMIMIGEGGPQGVVPFRPAELHVYVEDVDAAFERALAAGATSLGEPADRPYGERAGFVRDPVGNHWFIATQLGGSYVPERLRTVTPFLHAPGAAQYSDFLRAAFGAVEERRQDAPDGRVVYAQLRIGNAAIELGEVTGSIAAMPAAFYLAVGDADALYERALAAGARSLSPPADQRSGDRVAVVEDAVGNQWLIARPA
jgi:PhnB protein